MKIMAICVIVIFVSHFLLECDLLLDEMYECLYFVHWVHPQLAVTEGFEPSVGENLRRSPSTVLSAAQPRHLATHPAALTNREREVLRLMAEGLTNRAIAEKLSVSTETIKSHVHHIMQKMHVNDRTQAAVLAARQQWL